MSQQINLFNPAFTRKKKHFSATTMAQALGVIAAMVAGLYAFEVYQRHALEGLRAAAAHRTEQSREQLIRLSKELGAGRSNLLGEEIARLDAQLKARRQLLADLQTGVGGDTVGFSPVMTALARRTMQGVWLTGVAVAGKSDEVSLRGRLLRGDLLPAYLQSLNAETVLAGRSVRELRLTAKEPPTQPGTAATLADIPEQKGPSRYVEFSLTLPRAGSPDGSPKGPS